MKRGLLMFAAASPLLAAAALLACGGSDDAAPFGGGDASASSSDSGFGGGGGDATVGAASGVVVLHAAAFPAFRLCFENYPDLPPQPDSALMPEANVVGVEVGSVIRIGAMPGAPGEVYVIDQREVRASPKDPSERRCGDLIGDKQNFIEDLKYHVAGNLTQPLGVDRVDVLAITGCGGKPFLDSLGVDPADCTDWDQSSGSLRARTVPLTPTTAATNEKLPVQLLSMSALLDRERTDGRILDVTFGALAADAGGGMQPLDVPALYEAGAPRVLDVDQSSEPYFGTHGFRVSIRPEDAGFDAGGPSFLVDQSLAEVQELSSPQTLPTSYYLAASNYALLLLGDPRIQRTFPDGGTNPSFDPRRAVHLLAVPVKEPADAGTEPLGAPSPRPTSDSGQR